MTTKSRTFTLGKEYTVTLQDGTTRKIVINSLANITVNGTKGEYPGGIMEALGGQLYTKIE